MPFLPYQLALYQLISLRLSIPVFVNLLISARTTAAEISLSPSLLCSLHVPLCVKLNSATVPRACLHIPCRSIFKHFLCNSVWDACRPFRVNFDHVTTSPFLSFSEWRMLLRVADQSFICWSVCLFLSSFFAHLTERGGRDGKKRTLSHSLSLSFPSCRPSLLPDRIE